MINLIKLGAIWATDIVNLVHSPFEKATFAQTANLPELETKLWSHLQEKHVKEGKFSYELPMPEDEGDAALFQGLYLGLTVLKNADIITSMEATRKYFISGTLIRGYRSDGTPNDTTSNDAATGMLFGLFMAREQCKDLIALWVSRIIAAKYALTDLNGKPTKYGKLEDGWKTDPLRITLLLALLALGGFKNHYDALYKRYKQLLAYPKVSLLWWDTDYDTHRAAIHLYVLYKLTKDSIYLEGLARIHTLTKKSNNAWVNALCSIAVKDVDMSILHTVDYDKRIGGVVEQKNEVPTVKWGDKIRAKRTLPLSQRGSQEFFWQRNMFSVNEWQGVRTASIHHSGLDWLLAYWMGKERGII